MPFHITAGILSLFLALPGLAQQQQHLTQYMLHQPFTNPAAIASYDNISAALMYKKQWVGFDGAPTFQGFNVSMPVGGRNSTVALSAFNDKLGVTRRTEVGGSYAYHFGVTEASKLSFGLTSSLRMLQSNYNDLALQDKDDPLYNSNTPTVLLPQFSFGSYYFREDFYAGLSIPDLLKSDVRWNDEYTGNTQFSPGQSHYYVHAGYSYQAMDSLELQPSIFTKVVQGAPVQMDFNAQALYRDKYGLGFSYRSKEILSILANYRITPELRLGYAFDMNLTDLRNHAAGSHEVMLIFDSIQKKRQAKINVPRF